MGTLSRRVFRKPNSQLWNGCCKMLGSAMKGDMADKSRELRDIGAILPSYCEQTINTRMKDDCEVLVFVISRKMVS